MTVGNWMADNCLKGCEIRIIRTLHDMRTYGAFKDDKLIDTKRYKIKY